MNQEDRKEFIKLFNEGFEQLVVPAIVNMHTEMTGVRTEMNDMRTEMTGIRTEISDMRSDFTLRFDRIERKLDATIRVQDDHSVEIKRHIGL